MRKGTSKSVGSWWNPLKWNKLNVQMGLGGPRQRSTIEEAQQLLAILEIELGKVISYE